MFIPPRFYRGTPVRVLILFLVAGMFSGGASAALEITEFLAINSGDVLVDEDGDSSDWVEIHNPDAAAVDLEGYGLSDDVDRPLRWLFPAVTLDPGAYLIVFASGKDRAVTGMELHANFSLNGSGEHLGLSNPSGAPVSAFTPEYPEQQRDISFGVGAVGGTGYLLVPTPGAANGEALSSFTDPPSFSVAHGYYKQPVLVELVAATPGSRLLYTTDGSVPTRLNGQEYHEPIVVGSTTIFRAIAIVPGAVPSTVVTSSYLFPADVKNQAGMSQLVAAAPEYASEIEDAIAGLPAISLAMKNDRFLGPDGIYTNFLERGREAEVPVSIEYFDPQGEGNGDGGFQIDAGIRIHGGQARFHEKKPLRLYFRSDYGAGRLDYPLFEGSRVKEFDRLVLRSCGHDGWAIDWGDGRNDLTETATYMRDEFLRRSEQEMGLLSPYGKFVHVFVNGEYWGMYDLHERADAAYFASHEGGRESDWDVIEGGGFLADGEATAWNNLLSLGATQVSNAAQYAEVENLLDMDIFIDSMISRIWSGDNDWLGPVFFGTFSTGANNRNWFGGRRSRGADDQPFHFFAWDAEISLGNDRFTNSGNHMLQSDLTRVNTPQSPSVPYDGLRRYEEFQVNFADRLYRYFFNDGVLTPERSKERWDSLSDRVRGPVVAESARWGNIHGGVPLRRDVEWDDERLWVRDTFLDRRTAIVLNQFKAVDLYPDVEPPEFPSVEGGVYPAPVDITMAVPFGQNGQIFYTLDGSDPRRAASVDVEIILAENSPARVLVPSVENGGAALGDAWKEFEDPAGIGDWIEGPAAVGYETQGTDYRSLLRVDVEDEMFGVNGSVYVRVEFEVPDQATIDAIERLVLKMKYDDGFVAYLNGDNLAMRNSPVNPAWDSLATAGQSDQAAVLFQEIDITSSLHLLRVGRNVLALQGLNGATLSSDLLLVPAISASGVEVMAGLGAAAIEYSGQFAVAAPSSVKARFLSADGEWSALREEVFVIGARAATAGDLAVSEISYHPRDPEGAAEEAVAGNDGDFEFIEVQNVTGESVEMGGVEFADGIDFVFPAGVLPAGESLLVVKREGAFVVRYPSVPSSQIAGEFSGGTGLSNGGEQIVLVGAAGETIVDFVYDDRSPWPTEPDGDGQTLALVDPFSSPDHSLAASWRSSRRVDGSPGGDEDGLDVDLDGLPDSWEILWFMDLAETGSGDSDGDGLDHATEFAEGTNPTSNDTDFDGLTDGVEIAAGTDPLVRDTDGDGMTDGVEVLVHGTDPLSRDTDGDGLDDSYEVLVSLTDPLSRDSDGDGSGDFSEVRRGSDPGSGSSVALAREGDFLIYASLDSPELLGGGALEMEWEPVVGALGGGLCFGVGDSVSYREIGDPGALSLSAVLWFKLDSPGGSRTLVSKGDAWAVVADGDSLVLRLAGIGELPLASGVSTGSWHQVAMVIDREIAVVRGFFDGDEIGSLPVGAGVVIDSPEGLSLGGSGDTGVCIDEFSLLRFGLHPNEVKALYDGVALNLRAIDIVGNGDMDLDGLNDDWERMRFGNLDETGSGDSDGDGLTHREEQLLGTDPLLEDSDGDGLGDRQEVLAGMDPLNASDGPDLGADLLLYSSFDATTVTGQSSGARVFDLSVPSENGIVNSAVGIVPGRVGDAIRKSEGNVNYTDVHDPGTGSYSVSVWFQADRLEQGVVQRVVGKGIIAEEGASSGWQIVVFGEEVAAIGGSESGQEWFLRGMPQGQARLRVGEWNHVALVIDRSPGNGRVRLFVNGAEIIPDGLDDVAIPEGLAVEDPAPLITHGDSGAGTRFSGSVDELAIWGRAISPGEIAALNRGGILLAGVGDLTGSAGLEPDFSAIPNEISVVLNPGESTTLDALLANTGDGRAQWVADLSFSEELTLETVLERVDEGAAELLEPIPFRFAFTEGVVGMEINDGDLDMYDGGNILNTDKATEISYSDGFVRDSTAFGETGRYFTRKLNGGLWVLAADLDGVDYFEITGDLGADGIGTADGVVLSVERAGRTFLGFVKRVYDGVDVNSGVFDPTVNHLIIVEDNGLANHTFSTNTNSDQHRVRDLTGVRRMYHLLYSSQEGLMISDDDTLEIFETFLDTVGVSPGWLRLAEDAGQIDADREFQLGLNFDGATLVPGVEEATIHMFSNDPDAAQIDIPVRLRINAMPTPSAPMEVAVGEDEGPVTVDLDSLFSDDGASDGEVLSYEVLSVSNPEIIGALGTSISGAELTLALMPDSFGTVTASVRATDPQGLSADQDVIVRVAPINDLPELVNRFQIQIDEDSGPIAVELREFFDDVEDGPGGLSFALGGLADGSLIGPPFLDRLTARLMFGLVPDANGVALVPVRATDSDGGVLETDLEVVIRPIQDAPRTVGTIPLVTANAAASDAHLSLRDYFRDPDLDDEARYSITGNTNPDLFSSLRPNRITGELPIVFAPFVSGSAQITVRMTDSRGNWAEQVFTIVLPEIDVPGVVVESDLKLNRQTGLWEQTLTFTNGALRDIGAVRLLVGGLPPGVSVHNASGQLADGRAEVTYNRTLPAGETVSLILEYYSRDRTGAIAPEVAVEVSLRQAVMSAGEHFAIDRVIRLASGNTLVEFPSEPGGLYLVQYSDHMRNWKDALVRLRAGGTRVQWIDRGAPATDSAPDEGNSRFYRVLRLAD